ncbi:MAG: stage V sporulation protein E [candidate division TM6 bacterium GW2011_GWF2_43_17]|nr:MAG: stage V sporulation protein E [candidate division TM6 bacterium GW2011_GWF2_43_17]HAU30417.1 putative lipid II flippase FtsW [Candidatus Dependentiae bacterium]
MTQRSSLRITLISIIISLVIIGLVFIYSSSSFYATQLYGDGAFFVKKQLVGILLSALIVYALAMLPLDIIRRAAPLLFVTSLIITYATLIPGIGCTINGSRRWLLIGGFSLQPSEILKASFILYLASYLERKQVTPVKSHKILAPILFLMGICCFALLKQPDFGQAVTLSFTALALFFVAGGNIQYLLMLAGLGIAGGIALIVAKPYRFRRVLIFINPWKDPQGAGFQIIQSLIAIGSGKWWGTGIAQSKQKFFYLPMQHTDFIFSVIAEETGFCGIAFLICLFIALLFTGTKLARAMTTTFGTMTCLGFTFLVIFQTIINIFVSSGLAPTKGIGLPFISYGGSSLIGLALLLGVVINASLEEHAHE